MNTSSDICKGCVHDGTLQNVDSTCQYCACGEKYEPQPEADRPKQIPAVRGCDLVVIKCTDRLPEKPGHYLAYAPLSFPKNCHWVVAEFYDDNNTFYSESSDMPMEDVTHWAQLPKYPDHGR